MRHNTNKIRYLFIGFISNEEAFQNTRNKHNKNTFIIFGWQDYSDFCFQLKLLDIFDIFCNGHM